MAQNSRKKLGASECRHFNGYKPCGKVNSIEQDCETACPQFSAAKARVLIVHLGALGAVVRSTALLPAVLRKYPNAHITWITDRPADVILREHPLVDRILTSDAEGLTALSALEFDVALVVDKSLKATGVLKTTKAASVFGFICDPRTGAVLPATEAARELWEIGISDRLKLIENQKTENRLVHEALELGEYSFDRYSLVLSQEEKRIVGDRRALWSEGGRKKIVGINTGCAATIAAKKLTIDGHVGLMKEYRSRQTLDDVSFVLLGGREDTERNQAIANRARGLGIKVIESSTIDGLRDGMVSVAACDVVVSGDSLGLHLAIGFAKRTVAWFGPTCLYEIELYGQGEAVQTLAGCSPCWKRSCTMKTMCYDLVDFRQMAAAIGRQVASIENVDADHVTMPKLELQIDL